MNTPLNTQPPAIVASGPDGDGYTEYRSQGGDIVGWSYINNGAVRTELRVRSLKFDELFWITVNAAIAEEAGGTDLGRLNLARWLLHAVKRENEGETK
jgi:hypothetical protein